MTTLTLRQPGATSARWCGATARALAVLSVNVTALSTSQVASTAVSCLTEEVHQYLLTDADYSFFGNNIAKGQFEAQVWAPVCGDPTPGEVKERRDVKFDWTRG